MPSRWATTHYLFTYRTGFMKRALWGEMLSRVFGNWTAHYFLLAAIALTLFVILAVQIVVACRRLPGRPVSIALSLVLLSSPALTMAAHLVGYLEQIAYVVIMAIVLQRARWAGPVGLAIAIAAAVLLPAVHEASIFWVAPLSMLAITAGSATRGWPARRRGAACLMLAVLWTGSTLAVLNNGQVSPTRAEAIREERTAFADIRPRQDAFQTLTVPLGESLADMRQRWRDPGIRLEMTWSLLVFGPAMLFLGACALQLVRRLDDSPGMRALSAVLVVGSIAAPLALHVVGWDMHRWNAMAAMNAGVAALMLALRPERAAAAVRGHHAASSRMMAVAMAVCVWNLASDPILFDGYGPSHPPFVYQIQFFREAIQSPDRALWIPEPGN
jgi:hypothetical protein